MLHVLRNATHLVIGASDGRILIMDAVEHNIVQTFTDKKRISGEVSRLR